MENLTAYQNWLLSTSKDSENQQETLTKQILIDVFENNPQTYDLIEEACGSGEWKSGVFAETAKYLINKQKNLES